MSIFWLDIGIAANILDYIVWLDVVACNETGLDENKLFESMLHLTAEREVIRVQQLAEACKIGDLTKTEARKGDILKQGVRKLLHLNLWKRNWLQGMGILQIICLWELKKPIGEGVLNILAKIQHNLRL